MGEAHLNCLTLETVLCWMKVLGFKYKPMKKHFYVDKHKDKDVVRYPDKEWASRYFKRERWMHR